MNQNPSPAPAPGQTQWAQHSIIDELHQGMVVATFEHPQDWPAHSQVVWNFNDTSYPVAGYSATFNPKGTEAFEFLPDESCFWIGHTFMYQLWQKYRGQTCAPPMSGIEALTQFLIPKYRRDRQNLRVIGAQPVPGLAQSIGIDWLRNTQHEGVMARIEYMENGRPFEEEFYSCVMWHPPSGGQLNWGLVGPFCFRAARGQLDAARPQFWRIATSVRRNPAWGQLFNQILQQLNAQVQAFFAGVKAKLAAEMDFGRKLNEYHQWRSDLSQQQFNSWMEADERRNRAVGDNLLGRAGYVDPGSSHGNLHYDYGYHRYVWTNGRGDWIHSDDAGYNPNHDPALSSNGPWSLAQQS